MTQFLSQIGGFLGTGVDPVTRNVFALIVCIAVYGVFILRDK